MWKPRWQIKDKKHTPIENSSNQSAGFFFLAEYILTALERFTGEAFQCAEAHRIILSSHSPSWLEALWRSWPSAHLITFFMHHSKCALFDLGVVNQGDLGVHPGTEDYGQTAGRAHCCLTKCCQVCRVSLWKPSGWQQQQTEAQRPTSEKSSLQIWLWLQPDPFAYWNDPQEWFEVSVWAVLHICPSHRAWIFSKYLHRWKPWYVTCFLVSLLLLFLPFSDHKSIIYYSVWPSVSQQAACAGKSVQAKGGGICSQMQEASSPVYLCLFLWMDPSALIFLQTPVFLLLICDHFRWIFLHVRSSGMQVFRFWRHLALKKCSSGYFTKV